MQTAQHILRFDARGVGLGIKRARRRNLAASLLLVTLSSCMSGALPAQAGGERKAGSCASGTLRLLSFPAKQSIGSVCVVTSLVPGRLVPNNDKWICQAQGIVQVPKHTLVLLKIFPQAIGSLTFLKQLKGDDLQAIDLANSDLTDAGMENLKGLTGLVSVSLNCTDVSDRGLLYLPKSVRNLELMETCVQGKGLARFSELWRLLLKVSDHTDGGMKYIAPMKSLRNLVLNRTRITDAGLAYLSCLPELTDLSIAHTRVTGAGLKMLAQAPKLEMLILAGADIDDRAMKGLQFVQRLKHLYLNHTSITDKGMATLSKLSNLEELRFENARIGNEGLKQLEGMPRLAYLNLSGSRITDKGIKSLLCLKSLRSLNIAETTVGDSGLALIGKIKGLEQVGLVGTRVTPGGIAKLKAALPHCEIVHD